MIQSLELYNFQSHRSSRMKFHPGVNIIVGPTDSGKTSIIRALRYVATNRPSGEGFISNWADDMRVAVECDEGKVERTKGKENLYKLDDTEFRAFGTSVPEEIVGVLNLAEANIQQQLDSPFLISNSPGEVAQHFNRIAHLEKIDLSRKNVEKIIKETTSDLKYADQDLKQIKEDLTAYDNLDQLEAQVEVLEGMEEKQKRVIRDQSRLKKLSGDITEMDEKIEEESEALRMEPMVEKVEVLLEHRHGVRNQKRILQELQDDINSVSADIEEKEAVLEYEKMVNDTLAKYDNLKVMAASRARLSRALESYYTISKEIQTQQAAAEDKENRLRENFPDVCPLCGTNVKTKEK